MLWPFDFVAPTTPQEVTAALLADDDHQIMAGGTDLLVHMRSGRLRPKRVIGLNGLEQLHELKMDPQNRSIIGAGVTLNRLIEDKAYPWQALRSAALGIATYQVRNRATVVGNLCHASPAADTAPPMLVLDAVMKVIDRDGTEQSIALKDFFSGPQENVLKKGQWVRGVEIPPHPQGVKTSFYKKMRYRGHDCSGVNLAGYYDPERKRLRFAIGACAPIPKYFVLDHLLDQSKPAATIAGNIEALVLKAITPISDNRATGAYRMDMTALFIKRATVELLS